MPDRSAFDLANLLLPEPRGRLLVVGRHPAVERLVDEAWDEVVFRAAAEGAVFDGAPFAAVLLAGGRAEPRLPADTPVGAIVSSGAAIRHRPRAIVRDAFPLHGRPLLWRPPGRPGRPSRVASPRGRVDFLMMDLLWPLEPLRRFGSGSSVVADEGRSLIGRLLKAADLTAADWQQTRTGTLVAIGESRVLKVPLERVDPGFYDKQDRKVERLRAALGGRPVERLFPTDQEEVCVGGWTASLGRRLPGRSAFRALGREGRLSRVFDSGARFLEDWYGERRESRPVDESLFREFWEKPLEPLAMALAAEGEGELWRELLAVLKARAIGRPLFLVPQHGDFWLNNLLVDENDFELTGVVDWDLASSENLPLLDLYHLVVWRTRLLTPDLSIRLLRDLLSDKPSLRATVIERHCERIGLEPAWVPDLSCRYWLGQIAQRAPEFFPGRSSLPGLRLIREYLTG